MCFSLCGFYKKIKIHRTLASEIFPENSLKNFLRKDHSFLPAKCGEVMRGKLSNVPYCNWLKVLKYKENPSASPLSTVVCCN